MAFSAARRFSAVALRESSDGGHPCARSLHRASVLRRDCAFLPILRSELLRSGLSDAAVAGFRPHRAPLLRAPPAAPEAAASFVSGTTMPDLKARKRPDRVRVCVLASANAGREGLRAEPYRGRRATRPDARATSTARNRIRRSCR